MKNHDVSVIPSKPRGHIIVSLEYDIHWQLNIAARNFVQLWHNNNLIHESRDFIRLLPFCCWREREREREREKVVTFHYHQLGSLQKEFFSHAMNFCLIKMVLKQQQHVSSLLVVGSNN